MSIFSEFLEEDIVLLTALPYRVGVWISQMDDDETTHRDDEKEQRALEHILKSMAQNKKKPYVAEIAAETLTHQQHWSQWGQNIDAVLDEAQKARQLVYATLATENAQNYCDCLVEVASSVALAHGEFIDSGDEIKSSFWGGFMNKFIDQLAKPEQDPDNISVEEQKALKKLRKVLHG